MAFLWLSNLKLLRSSLLIALCAFAPVAAKADLKLTFSGKVKQTAQNVGGKARSETCTYNFKIDQIGPNYFLTWENTACRSNRSVVGADGSEAALVFNNGAPQRYTCVNSGGIRRCDDGRTFKAKRNKKTIGEQRNTAKMSSKSLTLNGKAKSVRIHTDKDVRDWSRTLQLQVTLNGNTCKLKTFKSKAVTKLRSSGLAKQVKHKRGKDSGWSWSQALKSAGDCRVLSR